jgi:glycerophosphoryl diester phosphodiesterase
MKQSVYIAHRGAWRPGRRENTTAAIERAKSSGRFSYIELDVRRTRSDDKGEQTSVIMHDNTLDRLYDLYRIPQNKRNRLGQDIGNLTLENIRAEEIEIVTLADAMRLATGQALNLELKSVAALEPMLMTINDIIDKYSEWTKEKIVISSMNWKLLEEIKKREPELGIAMIYTWRHLPRGFGRQFHRLGARWIVFNKWLAGFNILAKAFSIRHTGVYSINSKFGLRLMQLFGIEIIFTDTVNLPDVLE